MTIKIGANVGILKKAMLFAALCAAAALPMAAEAKTYTTLDWIQGKTDAYIKSGYTPKSSDKIEVTLSFNSTSSTYGIFCARGSQTTTTSFTMFLVSQTLRIDHGNGTVAQTTSTFTPANNTKYVVVADGNTQEFLVDGTNYATMYDETFTPGSEMIFLASWTVGKTPNNYATDVKLYGVRIWNASGTLVCDFVPATDGTKYGLFNRVNMTFHASAGSADITSYGEASDPESYSLNEWQGEDATNPTDWNTAGNWSDGVPSAGNTVVIPSGVENMPVLAASTPTLGWVFVAGTLTMTNWMTCLNATTVTVSSSGTLTSGAAVTNETDLSRVWINCTDLTIESGGKIDVNYKGYAGHPKGSDHVGYGPGGGDVKGATFVTAPSHGGHGARLPNGSKVLPNVMPYDNPAAPELPGSSSASSQYATGRRGGGAVKIEASGAVVVNGQILANGENASSYGKDAADNHSPAGSGGSIFIACRTISGSGTLTANGGGGSKPVQAQAGYAAGGGMIAVHYDPESEQSVSVAGMTITAAAGKHYQTGSYAYESTNVDDKYDPNGINAGMGTVHFSDAQIALQIAGKTLTGNVLGFSEFVYDGDWSFTGGRVMLGEEGVKVTVNGDLVFSGDDSRLEIGGGVTTNWSNSIVMYAGTTPNELTVTGDLMLGGVSRLDIRAAETNGIDKFGSLVKVGGTMTIATNCFVYSWSDCQNLGSPHFEVGSLNVQTGGMFLAVGRGGRGSYHSYWTSFGSAKYGRGPGASGNSITGGSHGGQGAKASNAKPTYDDELRPCMAGSGGSSHGTQWAHGGAGGGLIYVSATNGTIRVDGTIDASGANGSVFGNGYGGGGSGGTIMLESKYFFGGETGRLLANGGDTKPASESSNRSGSGGGGRIAVWCGKPWSEEVKSSRISSQETPISDNPKYMSYLGSYSVAGGEVLGDYGSDEQIGRAGTVRFCYVDGAAGFILVVR